MAIRGFKSKALKRLAHKGDGRLLPAAKMQRIGRILQALDGPNPMKSLEARTYRLHPLKGDRKGRWAVHVTANVRITFCIEGADTYDIDIEDYH